MDNLPASQFASGPRSFVRHAAERMGVSLDEAIVDQLADRMVRGTPREQIIKYLHNIKGNRYPLEKAATALNFARAGVPGAALIVENIINFAPKDDKAFVNYAYSQVLARDPGQVELARLSHQLSTNSLTRRRLLEVLTQRSLEEGRLITWDSAIGPLSHPELGGTGSELLTEATGFRVLSKDSTEILTLCRFTDERWALAPMMVANTLEVRTDNWLVSDGFILSGPKCHIPAGNWLLEVDLVQPEWASIVVDVVANGGIDRLFHLTAYGNIRGSFAFEKLGTHAFLEVRLRVEDAMPEQWISVQNVQLRKVGR